MVDYLGRINVSVPVGLAWPKSLGALSFASSAVHAQQLAGGFIVGFGGLQQAHLLLELA